MRDFQPRDKCAVNSRSESKLFLADPDQATTSFDLSSNGLTEVEIGDAWHPLTVAGLNHLCTSINGT